MTNLYYTNDFLIRIRFEDASGAEIDPPKCNWEAKFSTSVYGNTYLAMCVDGIFIKCRCDKSAIIVPFDNHGLMPGALMVTFTGDIPANGYPDGKAHICTKETTKITLTDSHNCSASVSAIHTVTLRLPLFASDIVDSPANPDDGKPDGCDCPTYEPFTPGEILDLIDEVVREGESNQQ